MKNAAFILLFLAVIFGGGYLLTTETTTESASPSAPIPTLADDTLKTGPAKPLPEPGAPEEAERPVASENGPWPKAVAEELEFDFGRMVVGGEQDHVFTIENEGEADLELLEGEPTCKCTKFELSRRIVPPGESAELTIRWVGKFKDANFAHGGRIYTNDPELPEFGVRVVGIVDQSFDILPTDVWNVPTSIGDGGTKVEGYILSRVFEDFEITDFKCDSPDFETTVTKLTPERIEGLEMRDGVLSGYEVAVSVKPDMKPGLIESKLHLTMDKGDGEATIELHAQKDGPIRILPQPGVSWSAERNGLGLGRFRATDGRKASLILLVDHTDFEDELEFTSIESHPTFVNVELDSSKAGTGKRRRYTLNVSIPPGIPAMTRNRDDPATIKIQTNHPSGQSIDIKASFVAF
ncbi:DUF1573 domain-containing protein [Fuerstiella marisgermanici]|uniref:DUF1573 domain-containing protein n=1 Tax=Fuerstiella marisgermanici TaxID=1891926 RepID=A0A1P8WRY1_9PLAN|nr:DUF1573 domain-containing protein [Fuerstiella marisgermanici]APZ96815.1 hypothetical protein Fuma_06489 [Fuerstiella marisgermanici]